MHRWLIIPLLFLFSFKPPEPGGQQLQYNLFSKKEKIGEVKATKKTEGQETVYEAETHMTVKLILKQDVAYHVRVTYLEGIMQKAVCYTYLNKKLHSTCVVTRKDSHYEINKDGDITYLPRKISYSGAMLYFEEPENATTVFSELNGYESLVKRASPQHYTLTDGKTKKQNTYFYKAGILESAYINNSLLDVVVQRKY